MTTATKTFTIKNPLDPASPAQISYLTSLIKTKDHEIVAKVQFALASNAAKKGQASEWIDALIKAPKKVAKVEPVGVAAHAAIETYTQAPKPVELPVPAYGYYQVPGPVEDALFAFDEFKGAYGSKKIKLMKLKKGTKAVWNQETHQYDHLPYGKWILAGGTYQAKKVLAGQAPIGVKKAAEIGKLVGFCIRCGRTLTDPVSVAQGIGPVCITYVNWGG